MPVSGFVPTAFIAASLVAFTANAELVDTYEIGEGASTAYVQFDFTIGRTYLYEISWDGSELTGRDVFDLP